MEKIRNEIIHNFGNKIRIRVCGILIEKNSILLVKHHSIGKSDVLWAPPGGGIQFSEYTEEALTREFLEETGIQIQVENFLCIREFIEPPLHAVELFFKVKKSGGTLKTGNDPELATDKQIITEVKWMEVEEILHLPIHSKHQVLREITELNDFLHLSVFKIPA
jgi:8-oxo-dGTP diphosphatase